MVVVVGVGNGIALLYIEPDGEHNVVRYVVDTERYVLIRRLCVVQTVVAAHLVARFLDILFIDIFAVVLDLTDFLLNGCGFEIAFRYDITVFVGVL